MPKDAELYALFKDAIVEERERQKSQEVDLTGIEEVVEKVKPIHLKYKR